MPEPAATGRGRDCSAMRHVRGRRLHAVADTARPGDGDGAFVHGPPPGNEPAVVRRPAAGPPAAEAFASDPQFQATMMLLHERIPRAAPFLAHPAACHRTRFGGGGAAPPTRVISRPDTPAPEVQLLSNGRYHVMVTAAGGGYSRWQDLAVTRWQEDATRDNCGELLLHPRHRERCVLVECLATDTEAARELRSGIHRGTCGISSPGPRRAFADRDPHGDRGVARG